MEDHADGLPKTPLAKEARERERGSISEGCSLLDDDDDDDDGDWTPRPTRLNGRMPCRRPPAGCSWLLLPALFGMSLLVLLTLASPLGSNLPLLNRHHFRTPVLRCRRTHRPGGAQMASRRGRCHQRRRCYRLRAVVGNDFKSRTARKASTAQVEQTSRAAKPRAHARGAAGRCAIGRVEAAVVRKVTLASFGTPTIGDRLDRNQPEMPLAQIDGRDTSSSASASPIAAYLSEQITSRTIHAEGLLRR